jgi:hypothetical protein
MKIFPITIFFFFLVGCSLKSKIENGDQILLRVKLTNSQGKIIDESGYFNPKMPLQIKVGNREIFTILDNALIGMELLEQKEIIIPPGMAYGRKGVFYTDNVNDTIYVVSPDDTLLAEIKVMTIIKSH